MQQDPAAPQTTSAEVVATDSTPGQKAKASLHFPRVKNLVKMLRDNVEIGAIIGAGISVSAGYSAFRSSNSIFAAMQEDYETWPHKDDSEDSFLGYAFSVNALRNDPRVQYRVLHRFDRSMHEKPVYPTKMHCFLQLLAEQGKLTRVLTQNIDDLEHDAGLGRILKTNLIQAHGSFSKPPLCVNRHCPGYEFVRDAQNDGRFEPQHEQLLVKQMLDNYADFPDLPQQQTGKYELYKVHQALELSGLVARAHPMSFLLGVYDDAVPVCQFCGVALKSSMVLYEEEINLPADCQKTFFFNCKGLLIIGTSLNVEPVNKLPCYTTSDVAIHVISKEINFQRYLGEAVDKTTENTVYTQILNRRMERIRYTNADSYKQQLSAYIQKNEDDPSIRTFPIADTLNHLTPLFSYHQGDCDALVDEVLGLCPEFQGQFDRICTEVRSNSKRTRSKPNYQLDLTKCELKYKYYDRTVQLQLILLAIPALWQPDAALYFISEKELYCSAVLLMPQQLELIRTQFTKYLEEVSITVDGQQRLLLVDRRFTRRDSLDQVVYQPIGGHWSIYCVAYNKYTFQGQEDRYKQELDPWSINFVGYQSRRIYFRKYPDFFVYQGVWRSFHYMLTHPLYKMTVTMQCTQHVLLGEDYEKIVRPVLFEQFPEVCDV